VVGENGRERDEGEVCMTCGLHRWVVGIDDDIEWMDAGKLDIKEISMTRTEYSFYRMNLEYEECG
jgi:hypothetical protein